IAMGIFFGEIPKASLNVAELLRVRVVGPNSHEFGYGAFASPSANMDSSLSGGTSVTLLARLRQSGTDQAAWAEFARRYGRLLYQWCRRWHLAETEAEEVAQTVLVRLVEKLRSFDYDPARSFRAYLKTLTHYAWCDFLEGRKRPDAGSGD